MASDSKRTMAMVRAFGALYGGGSKTHPSNYEKLNTEEMQYIWKNGRERDPRLDQVVNALSRPRALPLGPYAAIQAGIPCPLCPSGACTHGAVSPPTLTVSTVGTARSEEEDFQDFHKSYLRSSPVTVPEMPPPPPQSAPPATPELLRKALSQYEKVYADQWQRILEDDGEDDRIFMEIARIVGDARKKMFDPNAWWHGREPALGPDGFVESNDPRALKWSISGALYASATDDPQVMAGVRASIVIVATATSGTLQTSWFDADARLTRWNTDPKRLYLDVLHVLAQVHTAVKQLV